MKISKETLLIASFIAILSIGYLLSYVQKNQVKTSAAGPTVTYTLTPSSGTFPVNQQRTMNVVINTDAAANKISGYDVTFVASGSVNIDSIDITSPPKNIDGAVAPVTLKRATSPTKAQISGYMVKYNAADPLSSTIASDDILPNSITLQIKFTGTANGTGTVNLDMPASQVVGNIVGTTYAVAGTTTSSFTIGSSSATVTSVVTISPVTTVSPTVTASPAGPHVTVVYDSKTGTFPVNQQRTMNVVINTDAAANKISGYDVTFVASGSVNIDSIDITSPPKNIDGAVAPVTLKRATSPTKAQISGYMVKYNAADPLSSTIASDDILPNSITLQIKFTGTANGTGTVNLDMPASQVVGNIVGTTYAYGNVDSGNFTFGSGGTITPTVTTTVTPTGTISPTATITPPAGSVVLNMKVKFQGILATPTNGTAMNIKVMVGKDGFLSGSQTGTFTVNAQGVWSGSVGFNDVTPGAGYRVYVKGPKHVQKKVCAAAPTETKAGTYRCSTGEINILAGQNNLDFSNIYMLVGDLPNQDGVVDAYDTSLIQNNLGKTDAPTLANADLNLDGIVDTQDWSLVIASLNVKYDEL